MSRGKEEAADRAMGDMDSSDDEQVGIQPDIRCPDKFVFNRISGVRTGWYSTGYLVSGQIVAGSGPIKKTAKIHRKISNYNFFLFLP